MNCRIGLSVAILVVSVGMLLAMSYAWYIPLQTDGGWYSYPGYAMSEGRDPSENLLPPERLAQESRGLRAAFAWENRSFLIVRLHQIWFATAGTTLTSLTVLGMLQWLAVTGFVAIAVWLGTRSTLTSSIAALATMSDSWLISESFADLRPDVPIAIAACACAAAIMEYFARPRWYYLLTASLLSMTLPLLHTTGILAFVFCATLAGVLAISSAFTKNSVHWLLLLVAACGVLGFLFRQSIIDVLVPTSLSVAAELPFRHSLSEKLQGIIHLGLTEKLSAEVRRWGNYFLISNIGQLLFIGLGVVGLATPSAHHKAQLRSHVLSIALLVSLFLAPAATILDPHETSSHAVPLAALSYIAAGVGLATFLERGRMQFLQQGLIGLGLVVIVFKGAHVYHLVRSSAEAGVSKRNVAAFVAQVLDGRENEMAIAPTFLWPYVDKMRSIVLIDPGSHVWQPGDDRLKSVDTIILDRDFQARGWNALTQTLVGRGGLARTGSLGARTAGFYLEAYAVTNNIVGPLP